MGWGAYWPNRAVCAQESGGVCQDAVTVYLTYSIARGGCEGSTTDSRVLRDEVTGPNGLKITPDNYYLADVGYSIGEGFFGTI